MPALSQRMSWRWSSARLGVWSGEGPQLDLHQPTFDLDERALAIGVRVMVNIIEQSALIP